MPHRADCCVCCSAAALILLPRAVLQLVRGGTCSTCGFRGVPVAGWCHTGNYSRQRCGCLPKERSWKPLHVRGGRANAHAHCFTVGCCQVPTHPTLHDERCGHQRQERRVGARHVDAGCAANWLGARLPGFIGARVGGSSAFWGYKRNGLERGNTPPCHSQRLAQTFETLQLVAPYRGEAPSASTGQQDVWGPSVPQGKMSGNMSRMQDRQTCVKQSG